MTGECVGLFFREAGDLMAEDMGNAEALNTTFASVFIDKMDLQESKSQKPRGAAIAMKMHHWCENQGKLQQTENSEAHGP